MANLILNGFSDAHLSSNVCLMKCGGFLRFFAHFLTALFVFSLNFESLFDSRCKSFVRYVILNIFSKSVACFFSFNSVVHTVSF